MATARGVGCQNSPHAAATQILQERLVRRKAHIKAFYDIMAKIQQQTGISNMNTIASQFFSQEVGHLLSPVVGLPTC